MSKISVDAVADELRWLVCEFRNEMLRRGIDNLTPEEWLARFEAWLPSGMAFAEGVEQTLRLLP